MEHQDVPVPQRLSLPLGDHLMQPHHMFIVGDHIVDFDPEGAAGELHRSAEEAEYGVDTSVVAGQLAASWRVPDDVGVEQLAQRLHVALAEGVVAAPDNVLVWMPHGCSPSNRIPMVRSPPGDTRGSTGTGQPK